MPFNSLRDHSKKLHFISPMPFHVSLFQYTGSNPIWSNFISLHVIDLCRSDVACTSSIVFLFSCLLVIIMSSISFSANSLSSHSNFQSRILHWPHATSLRFSHSFIHALNYTPSHCCRSQSVSSLSMRSQSTHSPNHSCMHSTNDSYSHCQKKLQVGKQHTYPPIINYELNRWSWWVAKSAWSCVVVAQQPYCRHRG